MALLLPLLLLAALLQAPSAEAGWDIGYYGYWGTWGSSDYCPNGHHVVRFKVQIEGIQHDGDDTALNAIRLECSNGQTLYSKEAPWGHWYESPYSSEGFTSADFLLEGNQRSGDDTAANNLELVTPNGRSMIVGPTYWGDWQGTQRCTYNKKIVGFKTRVEDSCGGDCDDTALNGVKFYCR